LEAFAPVAVCEAAFAAHGIGSHHVGFGVCAISEADAGALEEDRHLACYVDRAAGFEAGRVELAVDGDFAVRDHGGVHAEVHELKARFGHGGAEQVCACQERMVSFTGQQSAVDEEAAWLELWRRSRRVAAIRGACSGAERPLKRTAIFSISTVVSLFVIARRASLHQRGVKVWVFSWAPPALGIFLWGSRAFAGTGASLSYSAPEGCATRAEFEASVAERGGQFDEHATPPAARELRVSIERDEAGFRGSFQTLQAAGASAIREVHSSTCQEVVAALAVVSAIALREENEANVEVTPSDAATSTPLPSVVAAAPVSAIRSAATPNQKPDDEGHLHASSATAASQRVPVGAGTLRFDLARSLTLFAGGELGILPSTVLPRYDVSFSIAPFVTTPEGKSFIHGTIPRLRVSYLGKATYHAELADVSAQGLNFAIGFCWSPTYDTRALVLLFCGDYGLGFMQFTARNAVGTLVTTPPFQTAGISLESEYHLGSFFHLALEAGVDAPLQRLSAQGLVEDGPVGAPYFKTAAGGQTGIVTEGTIFRSSPFVGYGMLGIGAHF
jgi:hypothetical protein